MSTNKKPDIVTMKATHFHENTNDNIHENTHDNIHENTTACHVASCHCLDDLSPSRMAPDPPAQDSSGQVNLVAAASSVRGTPKSMHGLHRTKEQLHTKWLAVQGGYHSETYHADATEMAATITSPQPLQQKGLHRTPKEQEAKMQAKLGSKSPTARHHAYSDGTTLSGPHHNRDVSGHDFDFSPPDPPIWIDPSNLLFQPQSQESAIVTGTRQE